jgi:hypothetical protein
MSATRIRDSQSYSRRQDFANAAIAASRVVVIVADLTPVMEMPHLPRIRFQ